MVYTELTSRELQRILESVHAVLIFEMEMAEDFENQINIKRTKGGGGGGGQAQSRPHQ